VVCAFGLITSALNRSLLTTASSSLELLGLRPAPPGSVMFVAKV